MFLRTVIRESFPRLMLSGLYGSNHLDSDSISVFVSALSCRQRTGEYPLLFDQVLI
jgi:hypothetical protein